MNKEFVDSEKYLVSLDGMIKYGSMELESEKKVKEREASSASVDDIFESCYEEFRVNNMLALRRNTMKEIREVVTEVLKEMKNNEEIMKRSKEEKFEYLDNRVRYKLYWYEMGNHKLESEYLEEAIGMMKSKFGVL